MKIITLEEIAATLRDRGGYIPVELLKNIIDGFDIVSIDGHQPSVRKITIDEINNIINRHDGMPVDGLVRILSAYDIVEASPKTETCPGETKRIIPSPKLQTVSKDSIIDYLKLSLQKGKRVWCDYTKFETGPACTTKEMSSIIELLQSDQFGDSAIELEKGDEAAIFQIKMPKDEYERTKCFFIIIKNNHKDFIEVQYY